MTYTAIHPGGSAAFRFVEPLNTNAATVPAAAAGHKLAGWLNSTQIVTATATTLVPAGRLFLVDRWIVTFTLSESYADRFVLLRGLLEFSRPANIAVSSARVDRTFRIEITENQVDTVIAYLETILGQLIREIRFKSVLKDIMRFENRIKQEQAVLYNRLKAST